MLLFPPPSAFSPCAIEKTLLLLSQQVPHPPLTKFTITSQRGTALFWEVAATPVCPASSLTIVPFPLGEEPSL